MKEIITVLLLLSLYLFISFFVHSLLVKSRNLVFATLSVTYFIFTYFFQLLTVSLDNYIIHLNAYDESGRTNELLVALFFVCILTAFITIIAAMASREKKSIGNGNTSESPVGKNQIILPNYTEQRLQYTNLSKMFFGA